jgi:hypothetical protein
MVSEPVYITTTEFGPKYYGNRVDPGGQYITFCYVGQIPADAVRPTHPTPLSPFPFFHHKT